ncbi:hypothetical protein ACOME3_005767 [Neoechinorhynchus agilis]
MGTKSSNANDFAKKFVDDLIEKHKLVVFSKSYCPYCTLAKNVLNKYKLTDIKIVEIEDMPECKQIQKYLGGLCDGIKTVPRIFLDGKCVGGGSDVEKLHRDNKLSRMLADANVLSKEPIDDEKN